MKLALCKRLVSFVFFGGLLLFLCNSISYGQPVSGYTMTTFDGGYNDISATGDGLLFEEDDNSTSIGSPFAFTYDNISYPEGTTIGITSNGFMVWGSDADPVPTFDPYAWADGVSNAIMPFNTDMWEIFVYSEVTGTAPNRVLTIQWDGYDFPQSDPFNSFQVKLYETSNAIEFLYASYNLSDAVIPDLGGQDPYYPIIGLQGDIPSSNNKYFFSPGSPNTTTPDADIRFVPIPPINVQLGITPTNPKSYNFGSVITGNTVTTNITATNVGDDNSGISKLSIKKVIITGDPDYTLTAVPESSDSILAGDSRQIVVSFSPQSAGLREATVTIESNGRDSGTQTFTLQGVGLAPLISVDTNIIFKNKLVKLGQTLTQRLLITSTNSPTLTINGFQFVGIDSGEYYVSRYPSSMMIPGNTTDSVFVTYRPTKEGRHVATMNIINNSINNPVLPITLYGTGILPHIVVTPRPLRFDSVGMGDFVCKDVSIYNPGTDTLLILRNLMTSNDGDFIYTPLDVAAGDTIIPPDKTKKFTICFSPKQMGSRAARVTLVTNIPKTFEAVPRDTASLFTVDITGTGVPYGVLSQTFSTVEGAGLNDSILIHTTTCTNDTIRNNGDADLTITSLHIGGQDSATFTVTGPHTPFTIPAHSNVVVNVCGTPAERGPHNGHLIISAISNSKLISSTSNLNVFGLITCAQATPDGLFRSVFVPVDSTKEECVTVVNCGDITATYTASITGAKANNYSVTPASSLAIKPGDSATFCVKYLAIDTIAGTASLNIAAANIQPMSVSLNGTAGCAHIEGTISLTADSVNAGGHYTVTVTLTNKGNYTWTPTGLPLVGGADPSAFTPKNTTTYGPIAPGASLSLTFDFSPTQTEHHYNALITFAGSPQCDTTATVIFDRTTGTASVRQAMQEGFSLGQNHPNPFASTSEVSFTTPKEAMVSISLRDLSGKLVKMLQSGRVSAGDHTLSIEAADLASGTYVLVLESGPVQLVRTVIIDK